MAKCKVCGTAHKACGPATTVVPVDSRVSQSPRGGDMTLKRYNVTVNDRRQTQTVLQLSDEDAKAAGLTDADLWTPEGKPAAKAAAKPAAKEPAAKPAPAAQAADDASDPGASE